MIDKLIDEVYEHKYQFERIVSLSEPLSYSHNIEYTAKNKEYLRVELFDVSHNLLSIVWHLGNSKLLLSESRHITTVIFQENVSSFIIAKKGWTKASSNLLNNNPGIFLIKKFKELDDYESIEGFYENNFSIDITHVISLHHLLSALTYVEGEKVTSILMEFLIDSVNFGRILNHLVTQSKIRQPLIHERLLIWSNSMDELLSKYGKRKIIPKLHYFISAFLKELILSTKTNHRVWLLHEVVFYLSEMGKLQSFRDLILKEFNNYTSNSKIDLEFYKILNQIILL